MYETQVKTGMFDHIKLIGINVGAMVSLHNSVGRLCVVRKHGCVLESAVLC